MTTQYTGPEDPAETARWEAEKRADHLAELERRFKAAAAAWSPSTLTWAQDTFPAAAEAWDATERALTRQAHRTSTLALATTAFISGALAALGVVAVAAGWHWLGAR